MHLLSPPDISVAPSTLIFCPPPPRLPPHPCTRSIKTFFFSPPPAIQLRDRGGSSSHAWCLREVFIMRLLSRLLFDLTRFYFERPGLKGSHRRPLPRPCPPLPPSPRNPRPKKGEKYVDFIFTRLRGRVTLGDCGLTLCEGARKQLFKRALAPPNRQKQLTSNVFSRACIYWRTGFTSAVGISS